ncbi:MAG: RNA-guided endonuclease TnpB family protein [Candidatus Dojkabacteria bacterium]
MDKKNKSPSYIRVHKTRIYPTKDQEELLFKSVGVARYAYNWALHQWNTLYNNSGKPSAYELRNEFVKLKEDPNYEWLKEVSKETYSNAILNLGMAWSNFFKKASKGKPKFKSKKSGKASYTEVTHKPGYLQWMDNRLYIPKFRKDNYIKMAEQPRWNGELKQVTISYQAGKWYASCMIALEAVPVTLKRHKNKIEKVGIDLGVKTLATLSDGITATNVNTKAIDNKIAKQQRRMSKKAKGSKNRFKAKTKLQALYLKKTNMLKDNLHKTTNFIVRRYSKICLETLKSSNLIKNHKLAQSIANAQFYEFKRQIEYKSKHLNERNVDISVLYADAFYPSSKTCSHCGNVKKVLSLSERTYNCSECGYVEDRDLNAAKNLCKLIA